MNLYPAIDLLGGRCVRLYQGDYDQATVFGDDPVAQAQAFATEGAPWIHIVDLDAAKSGEPTDPAVIEAVTAVVDVPVQVGGGVRSVEAARALWSAGARRVVVGTAAVADPDFVPALAAEGEVAVGLDARGRELAVKGWREGSGVDLLDATERFGAAGVAALVVTQIHRDGTLEGPDLEALREVVAASSVPVVASGGVGTLADLEALRGIDLDGVIVGRALYEGRFTVAEAVAALA